MTTINRTYGYAKIMSDALHILRSFSKLILMTLWKSNFAKHMTTLPHTKFTYDFAFSFSFIITVPTELSVLLREHRNCWYKPVMYYIARLATEAPFMVRGFRNIVSQFTAYYSTNATA